MIPSTKNAAAVEIHGTVVPVDAGGGETQQGHGEGFSLVDNSAMCAEEVIQLTQ